MLEKGRKFQLGGVSFTVPLHGRVTIVTIDV